MSITPLTLSGVGQYASDFQSILNRAVQIAQIPIQQLQNRDSNLLQQKSLLGGLVGSVSALATSLQSLGAVGASQALAATSSAPTVVSATATGATRAATYSVDSITSLAASASARSLNGYSASAQVSTTGKLDLNVGGTDNFFTLDQNNITSLRDKINTLNAGVTASILTTPTGNYLSLAASSTGATAISLKDDPTGANTELLSQSNPGANAVFKLNGITVTQNSNLVNSVVPGVTFRLLATSDTATTISLASDRTQLSSALKDFVNNYNALHTGVQAQVGPNAGLLSGDVVVTQLQSTLRQISSYQGLTGSIRNLSDLGVTFDSTGKAAFNQSTFDGLSDTQIADGFTFAGTATSGLAAFSSNLQQYSDPVSGLIKTEEDGIDRTDKNIQSQVTTLSDRINTLQANLAQQLAATDTLATVLQSQQTQLNASIQGLNLVLYGRYPNQ